MPCLTGTFQIIEQNQGFGPEKHVASVANRYQAISRGYHWLALAPCDKDATCGTVCCVLEKWPSVSGRPLGAHLRLHRNSSCSRVSTVMVGIKRPRSIGDATGLSPT